ncbi:unnamed protein product [Moritella viscosa]|uniref:Uncharacterized protein n=1 Tax=Moritella viscosa TaxID=80854 RepID=A0A1L0C9W9_9GAMM|nr:unnamed protein product [Moritella viscosa]SGZ18374.1 unnamed protein product [Moritella viscosa]SHN99645.1 unnamed protein product [Moritella viscosa]SHO23928.1 unnamed protein product [Moritella viscosa]SHO24759.1 unnamed protein product [Moritella viscosa]
MREDYNTTQNQIAALITTLTTKLDIKGVTSHLFKALK